MSESATSASAANDRDATNTNNAITIAAATDFRPINIDDANASTPLDRGGRSGNISAAPQMQPDRMNRAHSSHSTRPCSESFKWRPPCPRLNWLVRTIRIDCKSTDSRARRPAPLNQLPIFTSAACRRAKKGRAGMIRRGHANFNRSVRDARDFPAHHLKERGVRGEVNDACRDEPAVAGFGIGLPIIALSMSKQKGPDRPNRSATATSDSCDRRQVSPVASTFKFHVPQPLTGVESNTNSRRYRARSHIDRIMPEEGSVGLMVDGMHDEWRR